MKTLIRLRLAQHGMVLIVSLVILLSMTLLALAAIQNTTLEERMAGNTRAENIALQSAEGALRSAEALISTWPAQPKPSTNPGYTKTDANNGNVVWVLEAPDPQWNDTTWPANDDSYAWWEERAPKWWADEAVAVTEGLVYATLTEKGSTTSLAMANDRMARFVIEERGLSKESLVVGQQQDLTGRIIYQITARGQDDAGRGEVFLRSTVARRY
jgi:Tfp pilus assembly protein PilX